MIEIIHWPQFYEQIEELGPLSASRGYLHFLWAFVVKDKRRFLSGIYQRQNFVMCDGLVCDSFCAELQEKMNLPRGKGEGSGAVHHNHDCIETQIGRSTRFSVACGLKRLTGLELRIAVGLRELVHAAAAVQGSVQAVGGRGGRGLVRPGAPGPAARAAAATAHYRVRVARRPAAAAAAAAAPAPSPRLQVVRTRNRVPLVCKYSHIMTPHSHSLRDATPDLT